ncbi:MULTISPECIES: signal peptidase II [Stenotrophomonas]|jgi:signal peptidase II|nr:MULTISPECIES: signal peptidase II [Stenotrophomonas]KMU64689.1 Lipoprotein signal peptidase [Stenotrophomonas maltophilia]MBS3728715.1 Lipoprotein signal peptidase [Stenotrophomonas sp. PE591]MCW8344063.1 signal peptidase II [Stenotrophomonas sp. SG1]MDQ7271654.1 signal peptidase II [Stenotrophomonas sp. Sm3212]
MREIHTAQGRAPRMPSALPWLGVSAIVLAVDHLTKYWVLTALPEHIAVPVVDPWWNWYRSYNTGAAFSFLSSAGGWQRHVLTFLALAVAALLTRWLTKLPRHAWPPALAYALVIGGALGNAVDRILRGHVVDFIQWHWRDWYWPAFNLADVAIVTGAVILMLQGICRRG